MYYNFSYLSLKINKDKSRIYNIILKHNYSNFFKKEILGYYIKENVINKE